MATAEEIAAAKEGLTGDQLKWLGNADPTDPFIRARGGLPPLSSQTTVPSAADVKKFEQYTKSEIVGDDSVDNKTPGSGKQYSIDEGRRDQLAGKGIQPGGEKIRRQPGVVNVSNVNNKISKPDIRVKIVVPEFYLNNNYAPGVKFLKEQFHGIIFPYTPQIQFEHSATYSPQSPLHSNYTQYFYQRSGVSAININGKFTIQNKKDAEIYLGTINLLSLLTKMKFGNDINAGSPPPVCSLSAYGTYMIKNLPIVINSFKMDLPDSVDYYIYDDQSNSSNVTSVPIVSTISINCYIMYSRREIQNSSVDNIIFSPTTQKNLGYI